MQLCDDLTEQRAKTIAFWSGYSYPGNPIDIARVEAFRELDLATATNEDVTRAYGGPGWAHVEPCAECGAEGQRIKIGGVVICEGCISQAASLFLPGEPAPKKGFFTRILGG